MKRRGQKIKQAESGELYTDESTLQRYCVKWFRTVFHTIAKFIFSIPNGGKYGGKTNAKTGHSIQASIMVGEGLTEGVADLFLAIPRCGLHGLFIEMKTIVGTWDKAQREFAERQIGQGYGYVLCWRASDFEEEVTNYLKGTYEQIPFDKIPTTAKASDRYRSSRKAVANVPEGRRPVY